MIPHYELDTLPDPGWPRLFAVSQHGRQEIPRAEWGHRIIDAVHYAACSGYTRSRQVGDGLLWLEKSIPYPGTSSRVESMLAHALKREGVSA